MERGSLEELVLTRSVTKHIKKQNKGFVQGTGVGHDFARCGELITTEAVSTKPYIAWVKAFNNFYVSGGKAELVRITALLPEETKEGFVKEYMNLFNELAVCEKVQLAGGHTQVSYCYREPSFVVTVIGRTSDYSHQKKLIKPGADIIMTGYAGMLGTDLILKEKYDELRKTFSKAYLAERFPWRENKRAANSLYSIKAAAELMAREEDVYYMHDISHGGVYGALWQLGAYLSKGISIGHFSIPILQATIEFCEVFGLNPYMLEGTGAMLVVAKAGSGISLTEKLLANGINATVVGRVESCNERMVYLGEALSVSTVEKNSPDEAAFFKDASDKYIERRCLSPVKGDQIYNVTDSL